MLFHPKRLTNPISTRYQPLPDFHLWQRYVQKGCFLKICPHMVIRASPPKFQFLGKKMNSIQSALLIRFQRGINHFLMIIFSRDMPEKVIFGQYAQIRKLGPSPPKNIENMKKLSTTSVSSFLMKLLILFPILGILGALCSV